MSTSSGMKARDVMTAPVVSVTPDAGVREIAALLSEHRIGALVVLEAGRLAGIVSEGDILRRRAHDTRSHGRLARDIMTRGVVWVSDAAPISAVAALILREHVRRVPVLCGWRLAGIISRADLVRAMARTPAATNDVRGAGVQWIWNSNAAR